MATVKRGRPPKAIPSEIQEVMCPVRRWGYNRKYWLVFAIKRAFITRDDAKKLHNLSEEELVGWERTIESFGPSGLLNRKTVARRRTESATTE